MECKKCGTKFDEGIFCPECGTKVEVELSAEEKEQFDKGVAEREILLAKQKTEQERIAKEREDAERLEREKQEQEKLAREKEAQEKAEQERLLQERKEAERLERERKEKERLEKEKLEQERVAKEKAEQERMEQKRIAKEKADQERAAKAIENEGKTMSILSLICGITAIVSLGCWFIPEILGIVFACLGKKQGKMRGMAKAGLICSIVSIAILFGIFAWGMTL